jgi:diguanylate cyclase (GGDEF)-like protein
MSHLGLMAALDMAEQLFRTRRLDEAEALCDTVVAVVRASSLPTLERTALEARAAYRQARIARRTDRLDDGLRSVYRGLAAAREALDGRVETLLRAELVHTLSSLGQNDEAAREAEGALECAVFWDDDVGRAAAHEALASVHWMTADWPLAQAAYETALTLARDSRQLELQVLCTMGLAAAQNGVAVLAEESGRAEVARAGFRRSVALQREAADLAALLGDVHLLMYCELNTACSLHSCREYDEAAAVLERLLATPDSDPLHGNAYATLGLIALDQGEPQAAVKLLHTALERDEVIGKPYPVLLALEYLVDAYEAVGDLASALATMRKYHALSVQNASDKALSRARAMAVKYETEQALAVAQAQRERADRLERTNADLADVAAFHARAAMLDGLTGVPNRRTFDTAAAQRVSPDGAGLTSCSVALFDLDHFKQVNDDFSHPVGDEVLRRVAALLQLGCRRDDVLARYGGEEFVLLAADVGREEMWQLCEAIRRSVESHDWDGVAPGLTVTVSIGVAHFAELALDGVDAPASPGAAEALVALADNRLYAAKRAGRNRVCAE